VAKALQTFKDQFSIQEHAKPLLTAELATLRGFLRKALPLAVAEKAEEAKVCLEGVDKTHHTLMKLATQQASQRGS
jgi:hypothetical protein